MATSDTIKTLADQEAEREKSNVTFMEIMSDLRQQGQQKNNLLLGETIPSRTRYLLDILKTKSYP